MDAVISESVYYARHFRLPGFDERTQQKLRSSKILIVGMGGLGCPAALYLAGAGVGTLALCDADDVSVTNLHRQILFDVSCIGKKKSTIAAERLRAINPFIHIESICRYVDTELLMELVPRFDLVIDCTDNFDAKYAINDATEIFGVPLVYGSIFQFEGQVSVFHHPTKQHDEGFSYRDLHPNAPPQSLVQTCGEAGVIGVLPGLIGSIQANEAIKVITGLGETLSGFLFTFDALGTKTRRLTLTKRLYVERTGENAFEIAYDDLVDLLKGTMPPVLIDVRDLKERQVFSLGGEHIPLATLPRHVINIPRDRDVVVYCKTGIRSAKAALYLRSILVETTVFSLNGGTDACKDSIATVYLPGEGLGLFR